MGLCVPSSVLQVLTSSFPPNGGSSITPHFPCTVTAKQPIIVCDFKLSRVAASVPSHQLGQHNRTSETLDTVLYFTSACMFRCSCWKLMANRRNALDSVWGQGVHIMNVFSFYNGRCG